MDRKQFLKDCACGLCGCVAASAMVPGDSYAAQTAQTEDWRLRFAKRRYARLIEILSKRMDGKALDETLRELGRCCSTTDPRLEAYRGDVGGYIKHLSGTTSGDEASYDRKAGVITVTSPERTDCFCPLISLRDNTPKVVCSCSLGWQQRTWEVVTGKKVLVAQEEPDEGSLLRKRPRSGHALGECSRGVRHVPAHADIDELAERGRIEGERA
jgi:hypothetical protein